jgi:hypothetical protein
MFEPSPKQLHIFYHMRLVLVHIILYIGGMERLRDRTNYFKIGDGVDEDGVRNGCWVDIEEIEEGGAVLKPETGFLEFLDEINERAKEKGIRLGELPVIVYEETGEVVFVDDEENPIQYDKVMKAFFD